MGNKSDQYITLEMISRICSGDITAYEEFVREQWAAAVRTCWLVLRNEYDAEEAAQNAFINLYKCRSQLKDPNKFRVWFYQILLNAARQQWSRRPNTASVPDMEVMDPADKIDQTETRIAVREAMLNLGKQERIALVLRYFCDLTDREAAIVAGWCLGTYKWRLAKARRRLVRKLKDDGQTLKEQFIKE
ncbi:RNA polymerase sigma factor [Pelotomaculum terephthalicicum JT]|uniref:RNA polymerase sigma factor n=1 Tax=Pelotomaculum TaxID=191373 RepID=UPI0009CF4A27|nr:MULTISPECIES: sigma-70 family RNA polymerase sigma factor [Pelotomaculum]MCG9968934.1 RNA polymerase sigma factor [Pelotomaculum terephthalicicum JT]OPX86849.1 MAG: ECF RNA polymerase sigma factor SigW [Pelotomaculum sp. PtaB.Bin117]OPY59922.1 MAG: ECF RNA polymerase sigma factor SigW [Pelotomaculum sp. PtaU1.Bin065]